MNALTVFSLAVVAACGSAQILGYPGVYGAYSGLYPTAGAPLMYNMAQVAPVAPIQSQFHAQDEFGQYSFGFAGGPHSRSETRDAFGIVRGSYNYVDSEGEIQTQNYVADAHGFRVSGTNLPVAEDAPATALPEPVQYTPEVAAARADFMKAYSEAAAAAAAEPEVAAVPKAAADTEVAIVAEEAAAEPAVLEVRKKRSAEAEPALATPLPFSYGFSAPLNYGYGYPGMLASPLQYNAAFPYAAAPAISAYAAYGTPAITTYNAAAPAAIRDSELLRVVHNPKHAVSYRVD